MTIAVVLNFFFIITATLCIRFRKKSSVQKNIMNTLKSSSISLFLTKKTSCSNDCIQKINFFFCQEGLGNVKLNFYPWFKLMLLSLFL